MDLRSNLYVGGPDDIPELETPSRPARAQDIYENVLGSTSVGQDTEGDYSG